MTSGPPRRGPPSRSKRAKRGRRARRRRGSKKELDRREAWTRLADELEGRFVQGQKPKEDHILLEHGSWTMRGDIYVVSNGQSSTTYTRVRSKFVSTDEFGLRVSRSNAFIRLLERLGYRSVKTGDPLIDRKYVIRGSAEGRVKSFFMDGRMRAVLRAQESCRLEVKELPRKERRAHRGRVRQVHIQTTGSFIEVARVRGLFELCEVTLDRLASSGSASSEPVGPDP